jgi:ABC-type uncharacterized transport system substrate-binding protein
MSPRARKKAIDATLWPEIHGVWTAMKPGSTVIKLRLTKAALTALPLVFAPTAAQVHPHVFAEAKLAITVEPNGKVTKVANVWRFDDLFSETVLFEFDKDADGNINAAEQAEISKTIVESTGEYNYFEAVISNGKDMKMAKPADLQASFDGKILVISYSNAPLEPVLMKGTVSFGIYDPTFYTAIDFIDDTDLTIKGAPPTCTAKVIRPDADEALAQNQGNLTDAFFNDPQGTDMSKIFATRLELTCP